MVILEAMAAGLPVVAVNATGVDAFVENRITGILTDEDTEQWADAVHGLLVNARDRRELARAGFEQAYKHSVEAFSAAVAKIYLVASSSRDISRLSTKIANS